MERITEDINFADEYSASQAPTLSLGGRGRGRKQNYLAGIHAKIRGDFTREWGALITLDSPLLLGSQAFIAFHHQQLRTSENEKYDPLHFI